MADISEKKKVECDCLFLGYPMLKAIETAKEYISLAIQHGLSIGHGHGPTNHLVGVESRW